MNTTDTNTTPKAGPPFNDDAINVTNVAIQLWIHYSTGPHPEDHLQQAIDLIEKAQTLLLNQPPPAT